MTLDNIVKFKEENMSHNSAEEFFSNRGDSIENYRDIFLSVEYLDVPNKIHETELKLAETAIQKGCKGVTNIDYCQPCIAATGWIPK